MLPDSMRDAQRYYDARTGKSMLSSVESYMRVARAVHGMPTTKRDTIMARWRDWLWGFNKGTCEPADRKLVMTSAFRLSK